MCSKRLENRRRKYGEKMNNIILYERKKYIAKLNIKIVERKMTIISGKSCCNLVSYGEVQNRNFY